MALVMAARTAKRSAMLMERVVFKEFAVTS